MTTDERPGRDCGGSPDPAVSRVGRQQGAAAADGRAADHAAEPAELQQSSVALADTLKTVTARLDEQAGATRKAFADQRLLIEGIDRHRADPAREGRRHQRPAVVDDAGARVDPPDDRVAAAAGRRRAATDRSGGRSGEPPARHRQRRRPRRDRDAAAQRVAAAHLRLAYSDYTAGQYDLAIVGFQTFLKFFPRHMSADDAQLNIGNALYNSGKYQGGGGRVLSG